jgi:hypothetical protein
MMTLIQWLLSRVLKAMIAESDETQGLPGLMKCMWRSTSSEGIIGVHAVF